MHSISPFFVRSSQAFWAVFCVVGTAWAVPAAAQEGPITVIEASESLSQLAHDVAGVLRRRTGYAIDVGGAPPSPPEAVSAGQLAMVTYEGAVFLALGAADGRTLTAHLEIPTAGRARAVALAIQDLVDQAAIPANVPRAVRARPAMEPALERLPRLVAKPAFFLRLLAGYSPTRGQVLVGPGAGFGLCLSRGCVMVEADMPLVPNQQVLAGHDVRTRSVNAALRLHLRPIEVGDFSIGATFGVLTRILRVSVDGEGASTITSLGVRTSLEAAWRFNGPFEWVFEVGGDAILDSERVPVGGQSFILEDGFVPWVTTSLRMRPRFDAL
ncbi:MAG: hypothetical protein ACI9KE_004433 [Polyangiales bacterium]|jgi:hypothetical protein